MSKPWEPKLWWSRCWARLKTKLKQLERWKVLSVGLVTLLGLALVIVVWANVQPESKSIAYQIEHHYPVASAQFRRSMGAMLGPPIVDGNAITHLENGREIFPAMLEAIHSAEKTVCFETFVYWQGDIAERFTAVLSERARAGVRVHVLLDWVGLTQREDDLVSAMEQAGVEVELYNEPKWYQLDELNFRTHRKLLVVDGRVGFTGGVGIADAWKGDASNPDEWRDSHFRVEGPVVAQLQAAFMDNWLQVREPVLHTEAYFPRLEAAGDTAGQVFMSTSDGASDSMKLMVLMALAAAEHSIIIATPYFVPDELVLRELVNARQRGVRVDVIVPGKHIDSELVRRASRSSWGKLLEAGVRIYEYQRTMYHTKLFVVDEVWVSLGSANFDPRSLRLNDEANLNVYSEEFAKEMLAVLERDRQHSQQASLSRWRSRPWTEKLSETLANIVESQL